MSASKPTLGYPSRTAAVMGLRKKGMTDSAIADRIGIDINAVSALAASGRRAKRPAEVQSKTVVFPIDILDRLRPHADRRGISCNELARRLIETTIDEGMIDAVLDDQVTS